MEEDPDLAVLRKDGRWSTICPYLQFTMHYWLHTGGKETLLILPKGYKRGKPIPVLVGLHGFGSTKSDFANKSLQRVADAKSIAFVGVSGTIALGSHHSPCSGLCEIPAKPR